MNSSKFIFSVYDFILSENNIAIYRMIINFYHLNINEYLIKLFYNYTFYYNFKKNNNETPFNKRNKKKCKLAFN